ncbi:hypothetical protein J0910_00930 [Nocardiopsis sp. CNT-189]|uniref:hypothetical protein n=1 Tax=Nocardiopsis oceanisediminis TaxID=2816862 RepID=UPI003B2E4F7A
MKSEIVFDRSLVPGGGGAVLFRLQKLLEEAAPEWSASLTTWSPRKQERRPIAGSGEAGDLAEVVGEAVRWAGRDRRSGSVEVRGATRELILVVSVDDHPAKRMRAGEVRLDNSATLTAPARRVAGRPRSEWMRAFFERACAGTDPVWGAVYTRGEYYARVMADGGVHRAVGRDFGRYLPGLFPVNCFGEVYRELIGDRALAEAGGVPAGTTRIVEVASEPDDWDAPAALEARRRALAVLGAEHFFDKAAPEAPGRAPDWGV